MGSTSPKLSCTQSFADPSLILSSRSPAPRISESLPLPDARMAWQSATPTSPPSSAAASQVLRRAVSFLGAWRRGRVRHIRAPWLDILTRSMRPRSALATARHPIMQTWQFTPQTLLSFPAPAPAPDASSSSRSYSDLASRSMTTRWTLGVLDSRACR
jgi:hypothetical protein